MMCDKHSYQPPKTPEELIALKLEREKENAKKRESKPMEFIENYIR